MAFNIADFPEAAEAPLWLTHNSAWVDHIPMACVLMRMLKPRVFVELGTFRGDSYMAFCQTAVRLSPHPRCFAVDNWVGDPHAGFYGPHILAELRAFHDPTYGHFSTLIQKDFTAAISDFADDSIDLLHIDGHHTYEAVKQDFLTWLPKLTSRAVVLFHDTQIRDRDFGVWQLWRELAAEYPSFEVPYGCGLGILAVGTEQPAAFLELLAELNAAPERTLAPFKAYAARIDMLRTCMALTNDLHHAQSMINEWRKVLGQPITQNTPDLAGAWQNPRRFSAGVLTDTRQLVADAARMLSTLVQKELSVTQNQIGVVQQTVDKLKMAGASKVG